LNLKKVLRFVLELVLEDLFSLFSLKKLSGKQLG